MARVMRYCGEGELKINGLTYHSGQQCPRCDTYLLSNTVFRHCPECGAKLTVVGATAENADS